MKDIERSIGFRALKIYDEAPETCAEEETKEFELILKTAEEIGFNKGYNLAQSEFGALKCCGNCGIEEIEDGECNIDSMIDSGTRAFICCDWVLKEKPK